MSSSTSMNGSIPLNTLIHILIIKLSSTNYLLWKNQMEPILYYQNLFRYVDGSVIVPRLNLSQSDGKSTKNPAYAAWLADIKKTIILLHTSLS